MKIKKLTKTALAALAGLAFVAPSAKALTYSDGDLLLGFRATGGSGSSTDYLIDLGAFTQFTLGGTYYSPGSAVTLSLSGIKTDLDNTYGSDWFTNATTNVLWGIAGTQKAKNTAPGNFTWANTLFASAATSTNGGSTPWSTSTATAAGGPAGKIQSQGQLWATGTVTANDPAGVLQSSAGTTPNTWAYYQQNGSGSTSTSAYSFWSGGIEAAVTDSSNKLDLYEMFPSGTGGAGAQAGTNYLGTFNLNSNGSIQYTAAVPEPSSIALSAVGIGALVLIARRRRSVTA